MCTLFSDAPSKSLLIVRIPRDPRVLVFVATPRGDLATSGTLRLTFEGSGSWVSPANAGREASMLRIPERSTAEFLRDLTGTASVTIATGRGRGWRVPLAGMDRLVPLFTRCAERLAGSAGGNGGGGGRAPRPSEEDEEDIIPPYTYMREPEPTPPVPARRPAAPAPRPGTDLLPLPHPSAPRPGGAAHPDGPEKLPE